MKEACTQYSSRCTTPHPCRTPPLTLFSTPRFHSFQPVFSPRRRSPCAVLAPPHWNSLLLVSSKRFLCALSQGPHAGGRAGRRADSGGGCRPPRMRARTHVRARTSSRSASWRSVGHSHSLEYHAGTYVACWRCLSSVCCQVPGWRAGASVYNDTSIWVKPPCNDLNDGVAGA